MIKNHQSQTSGDSTFSHSLHDSTVLQSTPIKVLKICDISPHDYTGHSFGIGTATSAANKRLLEDSLIIGGRLSSLAYKHYIYTVCKLTCNQQVSTRILSYISDGTSFSFLYTLLKFIKLSCYMSFTHQHMVFPLVLVLSI